MMDTYQVIAKKTSHRENYDHPVPRLGNTIVLASLGEKTMGMRLKAADSVGSFGSQRHRKIQGECQGTMMFHDGISIVIQWDLNGDLRCFNGHLRRVDKDLLGFRFKRDLSRFNRGLLAF